MRSSNIRNFRVGLVVIGAGILFLGLLLFILGGALSSQSAEYYILFEQNVKGMVIGSKVNFQGVPLGVVRDIRFQDGQTLVVLSVDPTRAIIQSVTRARLDRLLVTGQVTVELEGYEPDARVLSAGSYIQPTIDPIHSLTRSLPETVGEVMGLVGDASRALQRLEKLLSDDNQARISGIFANLERATEQLPARAGHTLGEIDKLTTEARAAVATMDRTVAGLADLTDDADLRGALVAAREAMTGLKQLEARMDAVLRETESLIGGARGPLLSMVASLRGAFEDLRGLTRQLQLAPDSLIYGVRRVPAAAPLGGQR